VNFIMKFATMTNSKFVTSVEVIQIFSCTKLNNHSLGFEYARLYPITNLA
jgi:hypothetical protein